MPDSPSTSTPANGGGAATPHIDDELATFERVDWNRIGRSRQWFTRERISLVVGLVALLALLAYHRRFGEVYLFSRWNVGWEDWLLMLALVVFVSTTLLPLAKPHRARRLLRRLHGRRGTVLSLVVFGIVLVVGVWALITGYRALIPWQVSIDSLAPPVWGSKPITNPADCVGAVTGAGDTLLCHGSWRHPLGTDHSGYKVTELVVMGTRPVVYATFVTIGLIVPLATVVGVVAGYYGGLIDDLLMAYVDIQLSFPAMLVYLIVYMFVLNSMIVFLIAFGLLSWGGIARIVRSETLQRREEGYILTARAIGAPPTYIIRRHLIPNVSNSAIPAAFHLIAIIIITEAALSFLGFTPMDQSWGHTIQRGFTRADPLHHYWVGAVPAIALAITVVACKVIGDGLRDVLDPRGGA